MSFIDRAFCASSNCKNKCGRQMTYEEKEYLKELAFRGLAVSSMVSYAYFCGREEKEEPITNLESISI